MPIHGYVFCPTGEWTRLYSGSLSGYLTLSNDALTVPVNVSWRAALAPPPWYRNGSVTIAPAARERIFLTPFPGHVFFYVQPSIGTFFRRLDLPI